jgi:ferredoxin
MKQILFEPVHEAAHVKTESDVLQAMVAKDYKILRACGGKGLCATCHVYVRSGAEKLTPRTAREERTLAMVTGCSANSRLACQARVLGDGVVIDLPEGTYIERAEDLLDLLGTRATTNILHPINGSVLVPKGKIITRGRIEELRSLNVEMAALTSSNP